MVLRTCVWFRLFYEADRRPRLAALPENRPRRNHGAPVCVSPNCSPKLKSAPAASAAPFQRPLHVALGLAVGNGAPLVAHVLTAGKCELDLDAAVLEVELRRHERQTLLAHLPVEAVDLAAMQQQLARPRR